MLFYSFHFVSVFARDFHCEFSAWGEKKKKKKTSAATRVFALGDAIVWCLDPRPTRKTICIWQHAHRATHCDLASHVSSSCIFAVAYPQSLTRQVNWPWNRGYYRFLLFISLTIIFYLNSLANKPALFFLLVNQDA